MEMIRRPVLLIRPDVKVTRWRGRCWHLALERLTNYTTAVLAGVSTAVFCSRGDLTDRPEEKIEESGGEVYWLCRPVKFYVRYQTDFLNQCALCSVLVTARASYFIEAQIPNFSSYQLSDILHGFLWYLLRILVYFNWPRRRSCTKLHYFLFMIIECAAVTYCYYCYHNHHHQQQQ